MTLQELEEAYQCASVGTEAPNLIITPDGAFFLEQGQVVIRDFDDEGNFTDLPIEEQMRRLDAAEARLRSK